MDECIEELRECQDRWEKLKKIIERDLDNGGRPEVWKVATNYLKWMEELEK